VFSANKYQKKNYSRLLRIDIESIAFNKNKKTENLKIFLFFLFFFLPSTNKTILKNY